MRPGETVARLFSLCALAVLAAFPALADGGYFSEKSVAVSADQRAIVIKNGDEISMTLSTGYTGNGAEFAWIIPTPATPSIDDIVEAGRAGESAFTLLEEHTAPIYYEYSRDSTGCFPAGTAVLTPMGVHAIERVRAGTEVVAFDESTGEWVAKRVRQRNSMRYEGEMVTLRIGGSVIEATGNQPFLVVRGNDLQARPRPRDLAGGEAPESGSGRWVEARDLEPGDVLQSKRRGALVLASVSRRSIVATTVYWLEVEDANNYAVSRLGLIAHNKGQGEGESAEETGAVTVYGRVKLERYDVSVLGASDAFRLLLWLRQNGYHVSWRAREVLEKYIEEEWSFVAVKLNPGEQRRYENEMLPPLTIRYRHKELIFPLRISGVSTVEAARITLYVLAGSTVSSRNFPTETPRFTDGFYEGNRDPQAYVADAVARNAGPDGRGMAVIFKGDYAREIYLSPSLERRLLGYPIYAEARLFLTRLDARIEPSAMTEDIVLELDPAPRRFGPVELEETWAREGASRPRKLPGLSGVTAITATASRNSALLALSKAGTVYSWQPLSRTSGRLGTVKRVRGLSGITEIAAGSGHALALKEDGTVWAWGSNYHGQLGDGTTTDRVSPEPVPGIAGAVSTAAGTLHSIALLRDGSVWGWGWNQFGQTGAGADEKYTRPVPIGSLESVVAVAAGGTTTAALKEDGTIWSWGNNGSGQVGVGDTVTRRRPYQALGIAEAVAIETGAHTVALKSDGTLWAWGSNYSGQLGDWSTTDRRGSVPVKGLSDVVQIATGGAHTVALRRDGTVWTWGSNEYGQLGYESRAASLGPVRVAGFSEVTSIAAGRACTFALKRDGTVWAWGRYW